MPTISRDEIAVVDALRPHLARTGAISARLGLERGPYRGGDIPTVRSPAAALSRTGRVMAANFLFEALIPSVVMDQAQRLVLTDPSADALLGQCLQGRPGTRLNQLPPFPLLRPKSLRPISSTFFPYAGSS